jgi:hypothetical protein
MTTLYTVRLCKKDGTFYGAIHGSEDGDRTICGKELDERWCILTNNYDGEVTCKKCLKVCYGEAAE